MWVKAQLPPCQPPLREKSFPFSYQKGVTVKGNALAVALAPKVELGFVPWDPLQQLQWPHMAQPWPFLPWGSYSAFPALQFGGGEGSAVAAPRHTGNTLLG